MLVSVGKHVPEYTVLQPVGPYYEYLCSSKLGVTYLQLGRGCYRYCFFFSLRFVLVINVVEVHQ
jgi:hypothetical protein